MCWTVVYLESIRVGYRDRTYAMPVFALGLNLAWEVLYFTDGLVHWSGASTFGMIQAVIDGVWALFDLALAWTFVRFGRNAWPQFSRGLVWSMGGLALTLGAGVQVAFYLQAGGQSAAVYTAFSQNLLMSVLFCAMLLRRGNRSGQSLVIAWAKLLGTLAPTVSLGFLPGGGIFVAIVGSLCLVVDALYVLLLVSAPAAPPPARSAPGTGRAL